MKKTKKIDKTKKKSAPKKPVAEPTGKEFKIDTKFPPKKYERYPFQKMSVGDFLIEEPKGQDSIRRLSNRFAHRQDPPWKFSVRKVDEGFRCTRIQ